MPLADRVRFAGEPETEASRSHEAFVRVSNWWVCATFPCDTKIALLPFADCEEIVPSTRQCSPAQTVVEIEKETRRAIAGRRKGTKLESFPELLLPAVPKRFASGSGSAFLGQTERREIPLTVVVSLPCAHDAARDVLASRQLRSPHVRGCNRAGVVH